ncbi:hypothetical protein P256_01797 [Acinetobacter nectaris CIP 110549]|uniref:FimV domain-containing protein n=1 Tax=Acinetobacter nectaris CIP 110549 TaxID=1392540 RepID=V2TKJ5_9GAMM|nr:hypothetical protein [Acinetobacter nectaris]ESK38266.1 hypothetical protein P256_01797 [Acinetobacter nectaris CIP 110549]
MLLYIIPVLLILIVALVIVRKRNNTEAPKTQARKPSDIKKVKDTQPQAAPEPAKPKASAEQYSQIESLIEQKNYSAAEASINQSLNANPKQQNLYLLLLDIYQQQDDEFAINQLMSQLRSLELFEALNAVKDKNNAHKELQKQKEQEAQQHVEITQTAATTKTEQPQSAPVSNQINHEELLGKSEHFSEKKTENQINHEELLDLPNKPQEKVASPETAKKEEPKEDLLPLDFTFSTPQPTEKKEEPTTTPAKTEEAPALNFDFKADEPKQEVKVDTNTSTDKASFDNIQKSTLQLDPVDIVPAQTEPKAEIVPPTAQKKDILAEAFPELKSVNENTLNIDLAEQYIKFGETQRAKVLLTQPKESFSAEEQQRVDNLLNRIAS